MSSPQPFDPYYEWLAIPPAEQPPNLYRLLGLQKYEPDPDVIEFAADRQMLFLRGFRSSPRWPYAEALLNAVARAKVELLNPERKQAYDQALLHAEQKQIQQPIAAAELKLVAHPQPHPAATAAKSPAAIALEEIVSAEKAAATPAATKSPAFFHRRPRAVSSRHWVRLAGIVLGGPTGIAIGIWLTHVLGLDLLGTAPRPKPAPTTAQRSAPAVPPQPGRSASASSSIPSSLPNFAPVPQPPGKQETRPSPSPANEAVQPDVEPVAAPAETVPTFPASVELPPTTTSSPATLFTMPENGAQVEWTLRSSTALPPGGGSFLVRRAHSDPQRWNILFFPDAASTDQGIPIAKLLTPRGSVQFQWTTATGDEAYQSPLANCLLQASSGTQARTIQLRPPLPLAPLALDLDQEETSVEFELLNLPTADDLLLEVTALPTGGAWKEGIATAMAGKPVVIQFGELPGAEISVRLQPKGSETGSFTVRAKPEFVEGPRERFELTRRELSEMTKRWTTMGQKAALTIKQTQAKISALQAQLKSLEKVSGNASVMAERSQQMIAVNQRMKAEADRLPTHRKRLLEAEARLKAVPTVEKFLTSHDQAPISFRIVAQAGQDRIVLVEAK
jgi:hypothetical protein